VLRPASVRAPAAPNRPRNRVTRVARVTRVTRALALALRRALDRPKLWRLTAVLAALLLGIVVLACAAGSLTVLARRPATDGRGAAAGPSWVRWCTQGMPREDRVRLAFCARVEGRVIGSTHGPAAGEAHLAVLADFHLVIVRLPDWTGTPPWGSQVVAIGPLFRARDGQREIQAFRFARA
jgi:hypothetical protein